MLGIASIAALLLLILLLEFVFLGVLYVSDTQNGRDTSGFAREHLLTSLFVPTPPNPVPGKKFLGKLGTDLWQWAQWLVADDLLGWRLAPDVSVFEDFHPPSNLYVTDANGFSVDVDDPPITLLKPAGIYRVIVLGGSTVMGEGAPRPSQNIVGMLRKEVRERNLTGPNGGPVEFINAGVDGYNSAQEYLYLVSDLLRFKPDLVVVYDGWNDSTYDLYNNLSPFRTQTHDQIQRRIADSYSVPGSAFLFIQNLENIFTSSRFKLGMIELPSRVFRKFWLKNDRAADPLYFVSTPFDPRNIEFFDLNRRAFLALADEHLSIALFLQPVVGADDRTLSAKEKASWWYPTLKEKLKTRIPFYERARRILADLKAKNQNPDHSCIADLSDSLRDVAEPVYADSGHLLPKGNEVVAAHLLDQLVLCGLLR
jgi:hypothetical protein